MFIIDFDDTLFDTQQFKVAMHKALLGCGITNEDANWSYAAARISNGQFAYSHARRAEFLATRGYDSQKILKELESVTAPESLQKLLLPGAIQFLDTVKKFGEPLILLSAGDPIFQELKVRGSGIDRFFDRLFLVSDSKEKVITELFNHHKSADCWFINDKVEETKRVADIFPNLQIVLKRSSEIAVEDYESSGYSYFETLIEVKNFIVNSYKK